MSDAATATRHGDGAWRAAIFVCLIVLTTLFLLPILGVLFSSLKTTREISMGQLWSLPETLNLENFAEALGNPAVHTYFVNTLLIALITGITDLAALIAIGFANAAMILFGWVMELVNRPGRGTWWTPFWFGCVVGAGPWLAIATYLAVNLSREGAQGPPGFVYGILVSIFVLFNSFALNQWLQYRKVGPWRDYLVGETAYIVLSLVAKGALAWQIFANTLVD